MNNSDTPSGTSTMAQRKVAARNERQSLTPRHRLSTAFDTPPTKRALSKNPFEAALVERLHLQLDVFSPSTLQTPQNKATTDWNIEQLAKVKPVAIEVDPTQSDSPRDPELERKVQAKILKYFSEVSIPSPWTNDEPRTVLPSDHDDLPAGSPSRTCRDNSAQTILSLPPKLPEHVEQVLAPYFSFVQTQQQQQQDVSFGNASLCRKLFHHSPMSTCSSKGVSPFAVDNRLSANGSQFSATPDTPQSCKFVLSTPTNTPDRSARMRMSFSQKLDSLEELSPINSDSEINDEGKSDSSMWAAASSSFIYDATVIDDAKKLPTKRKRCEMDRVQETCEQHSEDEAQAAKHDTGYSSNTTTRSSAASVTTAFTNARINDSIVATQDTSKWSLETYFHS